MHSCMSLRVLVTQQALVPHPPVSPSSLAVSQITAHPNAQRRVRACVQQLKQPTRTDTMFDIIIPRTCVHGQCGPTIYTYTLASLRRHQKGLPSLNQAPSHTPRRKRITPPTPATTTMATTTIPPLLTLPTLAILLTLLVLTHTAAI